MRIERSLRRLAMLGSQAVHGDLDGAVSSVGRWLSSRGMSIGFERELGTIADRPPGTPPMEVVELDAPLAEKLFVFADLSGPDWTRLARRRSLWEEGFAGGFVAIDHRGEPLFLQWVIPPSESEHLRQYYGSLYPPLGPDTALGEGMWIPPAHRGRGIMAEALCRIGEVVHGNDPTVMREFTFVDPSNIASIKGHVRAGFVWSCTRVETWRAGVLGTEFVPTSPGPTPHSRSVPAGHPRGGAKSARSAGTASPPGMRMAGMSEDAGRSAG